jgi:hypothetical protein
MKKSQIIFDLMAKNSEHCLYHLGIVKYYPGATICLHESSSLNEANSHYKGAQFDLSNVSYIDSCNLFFNACISLISRRLVLFIGLHLWQVCVLFPLIALNGKCTIHLHGQAYALQKKSHKYYIWRLVSKFSRLEISNPAWSGPAFIRKRNNINQLNIYAPMNNKNSSVIYYSATGKKPADLCSLKIRLAQHSLDLQIVQHGISYEALDILLSKSSYLFFESTDDYYLYSPSGRISDALNYGLSLVLKKEDTVSIAVAKHYLVDFIII